MSVVEDVRKVLQDFLAPELRSISTRLDTLEKQRVEDKSDLLRAMAEDKVDLLRAISDLGTNIDKRRVEDKADMQRTYAEGVSHMEKRFELVIDYTKVLQRIDRIEESQQSKEH